MYVIRQFLKLPRIEMESPFSGRSALSPDGDLIAVTNLYDGVDWYTVKTRQCVHSSIDRVETNVPMPVIFIDRGSAILVGGSCGHAMICNTEGSDPISLLQHEGAYTVH